VSEKPKVPPPKKRDTGEKLIVANKRASFDFHLEKRFEAGIVLLGSEVKSCRQGGVQLVDAYATFERDGLYLQKANIGEYKQAGPYQNHVPIRRRKLLLHKREIAELREASERSGYTLIPVRLYFKAGKVKLELALARGKTKGDKRVSAAEKDMKRNVQAAVRRERKTHSFDD